MYRCFLRLWAGIIPVQSWIAWAILCSFRSQTWLQQTGELFFYGNGFIDNMMRSLIRTLLPFKFASRVCSDELFHSDTIYDPLVYAKETGRLMQAGSQLLWCLKYRAFMAVATGRACLTTLYILMVLSSPDKNHVHNSFCTYIILYGAYLFTSSVQFASLAGLSSLRWLTTVVRRCNFSCLCLTQRQ